MILQYIKPSLLWSSWEVGNKDDEKIGNIQSREEELQLSLTTRKEYLADMATISIDKSEG